MRRVLAFLLLAVTGVLAADERPVARPASTIPAGTQRAVATATDGSGFLTIWNDDRSYFVDFPRIWSVHTDAAGKRSPLIILQDRAAGDGTFDSYAFNNRPALVWTGAVYLAVWYDWLAGKIHTMRLDRNGQKLDATPREIATNGEIVGGASDGTRTMVCLRTSNESARLLLFDANGDPARDPIDTPYGIPIALASNGHGFLMCLSTPNGGMESQSCLIPISAGGVFGTIVPIDARPIYSIIADGMNYLLVYRDHSDLLAYDRYDATGNFLAGRRGVDRDTFDATVIPYLGGWLVQTWTPSGARALHLDHDGVYVDDVPMPAADGGGPMATNGAQVLYTHSYRVADGALYQQILGSGEEELLQSGPPEQSLPRLTAGADGYLALWDESRETKELRAARVDTLGRPLDGEGLVVTRNPHYRGSSAVAFAGANYIAAWGDTSSGDCSIRLARITPDGALPDSPAGHLIGNECATGIALGSGPDRVLLAWTQPDGSLWAMAVDRSGTSISKPVRLPETDVAGDVAVGWNGTNWLVAWTHMLGYISDVSYLYCYDAYAVRVGADGALVDTTALAIATSSDDEDGLSVGSNGTDFVVAWQSSDGSIYNPPYSLHARTVFPDGTAGAPVSLGSGARPSVTWTGTDYVIGFRDGDARYKTTLRQPSQRQLLATVGDSYSNILLASSSGSLLDLYLRNATEWPYLTTPTVFVSASVGPHRRAVH